MRDMVKTAFLLALFGYLMFMFGVEVGEFSERWNHARRLAAGVVRVVSEKADQETGKSDSTD